MLDPKTPPNCKLWKPERKKHTAEHACNEIVQMCQGEIWLQKNHITSNAQHAWSRQGDELYSDGSTQDASRKCKLANFLLSAPQKWSTHQKNMTDTKRVVVVGQDHGCFHFCWREAGWSSCSSSSRHDFAHLSVAHKAFTPCCEVASLPSKWLSPCPSMLRLLWECLYRCCCWLAGWLASVKKQQNPTDSNHCASDTESVWSSGVTSNSWEHFWSSCQLQTQTSRWVQEEEHRKHKRASHVPDHCGQQQQQQDESSLNSTLPAACLSMAWIWFPSPPSPPTIGHHPTWLQM